MGGIIKKLGGIPVVINGTRDHVHILCFLPRHLSISEMIKVIKAKSSLWHNKVFNPDALPLHWQEGYGAFSVAAEQFDKVRDYIAEQDMHHLSRDFEAEWDILENKVLHAMHKYPEMECEMVED
jgi:hypothetical protein